MHFLPSFSPSYSLSGKGLLLHDHLPSWPLAGRLHSIILCLLPSLKRQELFQVFHSIAFSLTSCPPPPPFFSFVCVCVVVVLSRKLQVLRGRISDLKAYCSSSRFWPLGYRNEPFKWLLRNVLSFFFSPDEVCMFVWDFGLFISCLKLWWVVCASTETPCEFHAQTQFYKFLALMQVTINTACVSNFQIDFESTTESLGVTKIKQRRKKKGNNKVRGRTLVFLTG